MPTASVPNQFTPGTVAKSGEVDANFAALVNLLNTGLDSDNIAAKGINPDRLADGANPEVFFWPIAPTAGYVKEGCTYVSDSGLAVDLAAGIAWTLVTSGANPDNWTYVTPVLQTVSPLSASSDNYIDLKADGTYNVSPVGIGSSAPPVPADMTRVMKAVTDLTSVTSTVDLRNTTFTLSTSVGYPKNYINGIYIESDATTPDEKIDIRAGLRCRDKDDTANIDIDSALELDATQNGANGLDSGSLGNNEEWNLFVLKDTSGSNVPATYASKSYSPSLPSGWDVIRRVSKFFTNGTADIIHYYQQGDVVLYKDPEIVFSGAFSTTTWTQRSPVTVASSSRTAIMDITGACPNTSAIYTAHGDTTGSSGGARVMETNTSSQHGANTLWIPLNSSLQYAVRWTGVSANTLYEQLLGYVDDLSVQA